MCCEKKIFLVFVKQIVPTEFNPKLHNIAVGGAN